MQVFELQGGNWCLMERGWGFQSLRSFASSDNLSAIRTATSAVSRLFARLFVPGVRSCKPSL